MRLVAFLFFLSSTLFAQHLYIVHGRSGEIIKNRFVLKNIDHSVIYFIGQEDVDAGAMDLRDFLRKWEDNPQFGERAHYVSYAEGQTDFNDKAISLMYPRYNKADETITFTIEGEYPKTLKLREVSLFFADDK